MADAARIQRALLEFFDDRNVRVVNRLDRGNIGIVSRPRFERGPRPEDDGDGDRHRDRKEKRASS
jgi:hypothetical protein